MWTPLPSLLDGLDMLATSVNSADTNYMNDQTLYSGDLVAYILLREWWNRGQTVISEDYIYNQQYNICSIDYYVTRDDLSYLLLMLGNLKYIIGHSKFVITNDGLRYLWRRVPESWGRKRTSMSLFDSNYLEMNSR